MLKKLKFIVPALFLLSMSPISSFDRMYLDHEQIDMSQGGKIRVHLGHNQWIRTKKIDHDELGIYITEESVECNQSMGVFDNEWKCPYCYNWSPRGKRCRNPQCPSKYTEDSSY